MLELIGGFPDTTVAVRGVGTVTADDYREVLAPAIDRATAGGRKARLLIELAAGFDGYDPGAVAADASLGIGHLGSFERVAVVTDHDWLRAAVNVFGVLIPGDVRLFRVDAADAAQAWISE
jgi:hypothetical protein